jgi:hypothetical protein
MVTKTIMLLKTLLKKGKEESVIMTQLNCKATNHRITKEPVKTIQEITIPTVVAQTTNPPTKIQIRCNINSITNTSSISSLNKCNKLSVKCNRTLTSDMATVVSSKINQTSPTTVASINAINYNSSISNKATKILIGRFKTLLLKARIKKGNKTLVIILVKTPAKIHSRTGSTNSTNASESLH